MLKLRKQTKKRRVLKIAFGIILTLAVLFAASSMVGMKLIYDAQFGRFELPDPATSAEIPYDGLGPDYPVELASFFSGKNRLQGYIYHRPGSPGVVVVAHGLGGGAQSYMAEIKYFLDQGWSVFAYDATGSYRSEGQGTRGFPQSLLDLDAALKYVRTRPDLAPLPVLVFGHSWGGYAAANILHFDHKLAGVVSVSAPSSATEMIIEQGAEMLGPIMETQRPFVWLYQWLLFGKTATLDAVDALNKTTVPALIIHGTEDAVVRFQGSAIISKREQITNPKVQFLALAEEGRNGHNNILRSRESLEYTKAVNAELRELAAEHGGEIPIELKREVFAKLDKALANEVNEELLGQIHEFFLRCVE